MHLLNLRTIVVATEPDETPGPHILAASQLAEAAGSSLHAVFVASSPERTQSVGPRLADANAAKAAMTSIFDRAGVHIEETKVHVLEGDPASAIGSLVDRVHADVIVLGPHRMTPTGVRRVGGTALAIATNAASPCLIVSSSLRLPLERVLVPVDLSDTARGALLVGMSWASALRGGLQVNAQRRDVTLTALHVQQRGIETSILPRAIEAELENIRRAADGWAGVSIACEATVNENAAQGIVDYVGNSAPELIVMGTRGLGLDAVGRLGSVAASVMNAVQVPVLLVPPAVWTEHARVP